MNWFEVDKQGLAKLLAKKGPQFAVLELLQNAWDENSTAVDISLERIPNSPFVTLTVTDNNPTGFADLSHAFRLFAESNKKSDETKRGRFNLGEKLVLALCSEASIASTTGTVVFDDSGRRVTRERRESGSVFTGKLRMTADEIKACRDTVMSCFPPAYIQTTFNGEVLEARTPIASFEATLPTEKSNEDGYLVRTSRKTTVSVYTVLPDETATLYEMGIPVVATNDVYHVDIAQKVPLNLDRDNVTPAFLGKVRAAVLEQMAPLMNEEAACSVSVADAFEREGDSLSAATVSRILDLKHGEKRVIYDPSDPEANSTAVANGYTVIHGGSHSASWWNAIKRTDAAKPAGQLFPTNPENTIGAKPIPEDEWTPEQRTVAALAKTLALAALNIDIRVGFDANTEVNVVADYGHRSLRFYPRKLGKKWFEPTNRQTIVDLIIHELGHDLCGNHLSADYYRALTRIGSKVVEFALLNPEAFDLARQAASKDKAIA